MLKLLTTGSRTSFTLIFLMHGICLRPSHEFIPSQRRVTGTKINLLTQLSLSNCVNNVDASHSHVVQIEGPFSPTKFAASKCWGRKPLLIRSAFNPIDAQNNQFWPTQEEISMLASDEDAESRIITHNAGDDSSYELQIGPFEDGYIEILLSQVNEGPQQHGDSPPKWTLIINDVERFIPSLADWIHTTFSFIPTWRRDDGQVSIAQTGGGIGPHVDNYDVFLIQTFGTREWRVIGNRRISESEEAQRMLPDLNVRILQKSSLFEIEELEEILVLEPGDCLYLPPRVLHHGTALSDDCMTLSVGCRAPSALDLVSKLVEKMTNDSIENCDNKHIGARYQDTYLLNHLGENRNDSNAPPTNAAKLTLEAKSAAKTLVKEAVMRLIDDEDEWDRFFGSYISEPKRLRPDYPVSLEDIDRQWLDEMGDWGDAKTTVASVLNGNGVLIQAEGITFCYSETHQIDADRNDSSQTLHKYRLFANGHYWDISNSAVPVPLIANERIISSHTLLEVDLCSETIWLLEDLVEKGLLYGSDN